MEFKTCNQSVKTALDLFIHSKVVASASNHNNQAIFLDMMVEKGFTNKLPSQRSKILFEKRLARKFLPGVVAYLEKMVT